MRSVRAGLAAAAVAAAVLAVTSSAAAGTPGSAGTTSAGVQAVEAAAFTPRSPLRVLDTRDGTGQGGVASPVGPGAVTTLDLSALVPATATAVVLNLTGVQPTAGTYVTVYPAGGRPAGSHLNLMPWQVRSTLVTVAIGADRMLDLFNFAGSVHLVADLAGHYATDAESRYTPLGPERLFDTRVGQTPLGPGGTYTVDLSAYVPPTATAVTFNLTAVEPTAATFVTAWPYGQPRPTASNLNPAAGEVVPNLVTVAVGADRRVQLYNHGGWTHLLADLAGYYTPEYGSLFTATGQTRVFDTRDGTGTVSGQAGPIGADQNLAAVLTEHLPDTASAVLLTVIGVEPTMPTFVTAWPNDSGAGPNSSTLNLVAGQVASNLAAVPLSTAGGQTVTYLYNRNGSVHVVADLAGYFTPTTVTITS